MYPLVLSLTVLFALLTIAGLIKPWWVLWWSPQAYRLKVLRIYGTVTLMLLVILWLMG